MQEKKSSSSSRFKLEERVNQGQPSKFKLIEPTNNRQNDDDSSSSPTILRRQTGADEPEKRKGLDLPNATITVNIMSKKEYMMRRLHEQNNGFKKEPVVINEQKKGRFHITEKSLYVTPFDQKNGKQSQLFESSPASGNEIVMKLDAESNGYQEIHNQDLNNENKQIAGKKSNSASI